MRKIILVSLCALSSLSAEIWTFIPYSGEITYDDSTLTSLKKDASFVGLYGSLAEIKYSLECLYNYKSIKYKDNISSNNLEQYDLSLIYTRKYSAYEMKIGMHYIDNNEAEIFRDLGTGYIGIIGLLVKNTFGEEKLTYGVDAYYSVYLNGHDDTTLSSTQLIDVVQFTPYIAYSKVLSSNIRNDVTLKLNAIASTQYKDPAYISYEISDTFVYKGFYSTLRYIGGEMKSGVLEGGLVVLNTKDLHTSAYDLKLGFYFTPKLAMDVSYGVNNYREYNSATLQLLPVGTRSISMLSLSYSF